MTLIQLRDRLGDRFKILGGGKRGRHATLRRMLDWSWELLSPCEQSAVEQVSVFDGGFSLEAGESVIDLSDFDEAPFALDVVQSLVDKSWLRTQVVQKSLRFGMYTNIHDYATAKRRDRSVGSRDGAVDPGLAAERRHGNFFAAKLGAESFDIRRDENGASLRSVLRADADNLATACRRAIERKEGVVAGRTYLALAAAFREHAMFTSATLGREVVEKATMPPELQGTVMTTLSQVVRRLGDTDSARTLSESALSIQRESGNRSGESRALSSLVALDDRVGNMESSTKHYEAALAIYRELGDRNQEGIALSNFGCHLAEIGQIEKAIAYQESGLAIHRETGNLHRVGIALANLSTIHQAQGRPEMAREHCIEALTIHRELGNLDSEAVTLGYLAGIDLDEERFEDARTHYTEALAIHRQTGNRRFEGMTLSNWVSSLRIAIDMTKP